MSLVSLPAAAMKVDIPWDSSAGLVLRDVPNMSPVVPLGATVDSLLPLACTRFKLNIFCSAPRSSLSSSTADLVSSHEPPNLYPTASSCPKKSPPLAPKDCPREIPPATAHCPPPTAHRPQTQAPVPQACVVVVSGLFSVHCLLLGKLRTSPPSACWGCFCWVHAPGVRLSVVKSSTLRQKTASPTRSQDIFLAWLPSGQAIFMPCSISLNSPPFANISRN